MSGASHELPSRQGTQTSTLSDDAIPDADPNTTIGLLVERLQAWKHVVGYLEDYMSALEKLHKEQAKEYEKVLKTISKPLREGEHFQQDVNSRNNTVGGTPHGGIAKFFETLRVDTQFLIESNIQTENNIKSEVLKRLAALHQAIKDKAKAVAHGAEKSAKEIDKARNNTQKHIELLGQQAASFESIGGKISSHDDPYVVYRGVLHRLSKQVMEENNHRNNVIAVQDDVRTFEESVVLALQEAMKYYNEIINSQAGKTIDLSNEIRSVLTSVLPRQEWEELLRRKGDKLINPNEPPRNVESITFPNMTHPSTKSLIEGSLERKSRNKLSWGYQTGYYVVTPSRWLHEFKDTDNNRKDPVPELSIYLPDAVVGAPNMEKFNIKGKDKSKGISSKLVGSAELALKAHTAADAERWFTIIKDVAGATGPAALDSTPVSPISPTHTNTFKSVDEHAAADHKAQEAGITGQDTVPSPTVLSPVSTEKSSLPASTTVSRTASVSSPTAATVAKHPSPPV